MTIFYFKGNKRPYGYIYAIQNLINDKYYIGQTTRKNPLIRWRQHINSPDKTSIVDNAIQKYGEDNFVFEVIDGASNQEELNTLEESYMCLFNSKKTLGGYNIRDGGSRGKHSEETKLKMSKNHRGMLGKKHSKKSRKQMSESRSGDKNPNYGKKLPPETIRKILKSRRDYSGENHPRYIKLDDKEIIRLYVEEKLSVPKIAKIMKCSPSTIQRRLEGNGIKIRPRGEDQKMKGGLFGFIGCNLQERKRILEGRLKPWGRVWLLRVGYNSHRTNLGYFEDPLSAEIVYKLVQEELDIWRRTLGQ